MQNLFDSLPKNFFNYLSSGSQNRIYSDCLREIYQLYEQQISFRLPRSTVRNALSVFLLENQVRLEDEEGEEIKTSADMASAILRKFSEESVGWLEEETDDATYEKQIIMTERGVMLAEFLRSLQKPEKEEYANYIILIYDLLANKDVWREHPYINGLKAIHGQARQLSGALKKLGTYIRRIIERMVREETLESLTENIIEYCEGSFIREYARLTRQQNIHVYRSQIRTGMNRLREDADLLRRMTEDCAVEENLRYTEAEEQVLDMIMMTIRFLYDDYDRIMQDIRAKINLYLRLAIGRARFLRSRGADLRGSVERTIRYLAEEISDLDMREELPVNLQDLFLIQTNQYLDTASIRYPRKSRAMLTATETEFAEPDEETIERQRKAQEREAFNPWSRERAADWLKLCMKNRWEIRAAELPLLSRDDLLMSLAAVAYARQNGYSIIPEDDYVETDNLMIRNFTVRKNGVGGR